jgi:hypothetical protein
MNAWHAGPEPGSFDDGRRPLVARLRGPAAADGIHFELEER